MNFFQKKLSCFPSYYRYKNISRRTVDIWCIFHFFLTFIFKPYSGRCILYILVCYIDLYCLSLKQCRCVPWMSPTQSGEWSIIYHYQYWSFCHRELALWIVFFLFCIWFVLTISISWFQLKDPLLFQMIIYDRLPFYKEHFAQESQST